MTNLSIWMRFTAEELTALPDEDLSKALAGWQEDLEKIIQMLISTGANLDLLQKEQQRRSHERWCKAWDATRPERDRLRAEGEKAKAARDYDALGKVLEQLDALRMKERQLAGQSQIVNM